MQPLRDARGLAVSTASAAALERIERALSSLLASRGDVDPHIDEALAFDPDFVFAHCVRGAALLLGSADRDDPALRGVLAALDRLDGRANARERRHAAGLRAWQRGNRRAALDRYGELLTDYPRDVLALHVAHALDFRLGEREMLRDRIARVLPHWDAGVPHFGYVLGMHAFGLEETGDYPRAEAAARRSLELVADNAAAVHVVAHVLEMQGRTGEGIAWLESTRSIWAANAGFDVHVAWHLALFHIDQDAIAAALDLYDRPLRPSPASPTTALIDASALLWRLELRGSNVLARWRALARCWRGKRLRGSRSFYITHAVMAFAGAGEHRRARRATDLLRKDPATRSANTAHDLALAVPVCDAILAFARGDYAAAVERIAAVHAQAERCGGSVAQCDVIDLTLLEAALRGRRARLAQALAAERAARRPGSRLTRWLFARAEAAIGSP
ncbi:MAG TPA: tetratricopeptide repeat protein [Casimicrobiaceae bacterium]